MYTLPRLTGIAAQTASMNAALAVGLIASIPDHEPLPTLRADSSAGVLARRLLPFIILVPYLIGWLLCRASAWASTIPRSASLPRWSRRPYSRH